MHRLKRDLTYNDVFRALDLTPQPLSWSQDVKAAFGSGDKPVSRRPKVRRARPGA